MTQKVFSHTTAPLPDYASDDWEVLNLGPGTNGGFQVLVTHIPTGFSCQIADTLSLEAARQEGIKHITAVLAQKGRHV
jgi:hypothetical protein